MHGMEGLYCLGEHDMVIRVAGTMVGLLFIVFFSVISRTRIGIFCFLDLSSLPMVSEVNGCSHM